MKLLLTLILAFQVVAANAKIPAAFDPVVVEAPFSFSEREFDLTAAFQQAQKQGKPLFIYLGASDCPPCHEYTRFLEENVEQLRPHFSKVVVVDIRTWLKGPKISFKIGDKTYTFRQFQQLLGDPGRFEFWPYHWLVAPEGKLVRVLPQDRVTYTNIQRHIEALQLDTRQ